MPQRRTGEEGHGQMGRADRENIEKRVPGQPSRQNVEREPAQREAERRTRPNEPEPKRPEPQRPAAGKPASRRSQTR